jgi:hypothetical protein
MVFLIIFRQMPGQYTEIGNDHLFLKPFLLTIHDHLSYIVQAVKRALLTTNLILYMYLFHSFMMLYQIQMIDNIFTNHE